MNRETEYSRLRGRKIVILIASFARGGSERQAFLLARQMRHRYGLDAQVWSLFGTDWCTGDYRSEFEAAGIPTEVLGFGLPRYGWVQRCWPIVREFRRSGVDILLPFTLWPNVVAGLIYRLASVRLCIWGERSAGSEKMPGVTRFALAQYRYFLANSTAGVEFLVNALGVDRSRIEVIPNGVEAPEIESEAKDWRSSLGIGPDRLLVIKIANLTRYKDHATLLRAWKLVQESWKDGVRPVLALAGNFGDAYQECQQLVAQGGLESTVRFLGGITDVPALLQACDLSVFSSSKEGMPNGVLESMAAGKAVIASDLTGIRDVLGKDANDVLVPAGDVNEFARKLLALLRDGERRNVLGRANRARIGSEFSIECLGQRYVQAICERLPGTRAKRERQPVPQRNANGTGEAPAVEL